MVNLTGFRELSRGKKALLIIAISAIASLGVIVFKLTRPEPTPSSPSSIEFRTPAYRDYGGSSYDTPSTYEAPPYTPPSSPYPSYNPNIWEAYREYVNSQPDIDREAVEYYLDGYRCALKQGDERRAERCLRELEYLLR